MALYSPSVPCFERRGWGMRHAIGALGFLAVANGYIQRFCLSLAITEMATQVRGSGKIDPNACPLPEAPHNSSFLVTVTVTETETDTETETEPTSRGKQASGVVASPPHGGDTRGRCGRVITLQSHHVRVYPGGEFDWSEETQGLILSSFFWGYVITQLPGGMLGERYGAKHILGNGLLISTVCTLLTPVVAWHLGAYGLIVLRFILGLGQGTLYPCLNVLMSQWAPAQERGRMGALVFAGAQLGNVISMTASGFIIASLGWPGVFYIFGGIGCLWYLLWTLVFSSSPLQHPWISEEEREYIVNNSGRTKFKDLPKTPWKPILTSVPLWGLIIAQIGHDWGLFTIITDLPKYMKSVLHFSVKSNGFISGMPYLVMWVFAFIAGWLSDWLVGPKKMDVTFVRKIFMTIASVGPGMGILAASYAGCDKVLVSLFFIVGMGSMGAFIPSLKVNALDLSPNYAGTLMALVGGIGAISGIATPYLVGLLTPNSFLLEWRLVFWICVIVLVGTNAVYLFTGSAEPQWWNNPDSLREYNTARAKKQEDEKNTRC